MYRETGVQIEEGFANCEELAGEIFWYEIMGMPGTDCKASFDSLRPEICDCKSANTIAIFCAPFERCIIASSIRA